MSCSMIFCNKKISLYYGIFFFCFFISTGFAGQRIHSAPESTSQHTLAPATTVRGLIEHCFESQDRLPDGNPYIWKYVYTFFPAGVEMKLGVPQLASALTECVLFTESADFKRRVLCCISISCGCPQKCRYCATKGRFYRSLTSAEIVEQVVSMLKHRGVYETVRDEAKQFQIMLMSMGEPFVNYDNVKEALIELNRLFPRAQLLVSTMMPKVDSKLYDDFIELSQRIPQIGLQLSIHPLEGTVMRSSRYLARLQRYGRRWSEATGRKVFLNYILTELNINDTTLANLTRYFDPQHFAFSFARVNTADGQIHLLSGINVDEELRKFVRTLIDMGFVVKISKGHGRDIGGVCGSLLNFDKWALERDASSA
ncbi:MAG: radical SAM protein [Candidatus Aureabacteria bacterium]|nr:radical SAM protein [Candidatus Auribacterota bacterium]